MQENWPTRRTALKPLGLGLGGTVTAGTVSADDHGRETRVDTDTDLYIADLTPQEDVMTDARGVAAFQHRDGELKFVVVVANIEDVMAAHIHENEPLGPIAVWLHDFVTREPRLIEGRFTGILDVGTITDEVVMESHVEEAESHSIRDLIRKIDAGDAFVNVHTEEHPSGELDGRIEPFTDVETLLAAKP